MRRLLDIISEGASQRFFLRATIDPMGDLQRGFSCVNNAWVDDVEEIAPAILDHYGEGVELNSPRQDPSTGGWCWEPERGLSSFAFHDEESFGSAMERVRPYAQHIGEVGMFASADYDLGCGADGEDVFRNGRFVRFIPIEARYEDL